MTSNFRRIRSNRKSRIMINPKKAKSALAALAAYGQLIEERALSRDVEIVRQWIDDDYSVSRELCDAIKLSIPVLHTHRKRFYELFSDAMSNFGPFNPE
jgi:hypothetical protein